MWESIGWSRRRWRVSGSGPGTRSILRSHKCTRPWLGTWTVTGRVDLVAAKRCLGHDGKDPGEYDPLAIYWYAYQPESGTWRRSQISYGGRAAADLDPKLVDLDQDGDLDLLAPARCGLTWFENRLQPLPAAAEVTADTSNPHGLQSYDHHRLMEVWDGQRGLRPVQDRWDWGRRRDHVMAGMQMVMGSLPTPLSRVPLAVAYHEATESDGYVRQPHQLPGG